MNEIQWIKYSSSEWWYASTTTEIAFHSHSVQLSFVWECVVLERGYMQMKREDEAGERWMWYNNMIKEQHEGESGSNFLPFKYRFFLSKLGEEPTIKILTRHVTLRQNKLMILTVLIRYKSWQSQKFSLFRVFSCFLSECVFCLLLTSSTFYAHKFCDENFSLLSSRPLSAAQKKWTTHDDCRLCLSDGWISTSDAFWHGKTEKQSQEFSLYLLNFSSFFHLKNFFFSPLGVFSFLLSL